MNRLRTYVTSSLLSFAAAILPVVALTGCAISAAFPDASTNPGNTPLGTIQGSDFGGHAPLIGAHVYVLQPSVTTPTGADAKHSSYNAYGGRATSLLSASYTNNGAVYPTTIQNTGGDPGVPSGWYYQLTDLTGAFNISGDYTCTAGIPVYLYLYGGSPTYPSANNTFPISNFIVSGSSGNYNVTMTINTSSSQPIENAYIGEGLTVTTGTGANPASAFNGSFQLVTSTSLTTTTFSFTYTGTSLPTGVTTGYNFAQTGNNMTVTFQPTFNSGVVNLAVLGNCPNNGTLAGTGAFSGSSSIKYVYVNEVSTVATAYAFKPFTFTPQLTSNSSGYQTDCTETYNGTSYNWNNATCIGTSSTNLAGLENAANIAAQLYDITGSNITTSYAGEGHIARSLNTAGTGIVPQANIDTLGNIIAACVDSNNGSTIVGSSGSYNTTTGTYSGISPQCNTLFSTATSSSVLSTASSNPGLQPYDTAMAAFNIARHPAGPPYSVTGVGATGTNAFVQSLYNLPQANVPFTPNLTTQPNDFTIGIIYTAANNPGPSIGGTSYALTTGAESLAIDQVGNVWFTTQPTHGGAGKGYFWEISPTGVSSNIQSNPSYLYGYVTIDSGNSAWAGAANTTNAVTYIHNTGTATSSTVYPNPYTYSTGATNSTLVENYTYAAVADASGNVYFGNDGPSASTNIFVEKFAGAATTPTTTSVTETSTATPSFTATAGGPTHGAMIPSSFSPLSAFFDYNASSGHGTPTISAVNLATGANNTGFPVTNATTGCTSMVDPEQMAVTRQSEALVPDYNNGAGAINAASSSLYYITLATGACAQVSGATLNAGLLSPFGAAVDGNSHAFITNRANNNGTTISELNVQNDGATNVSAVSPAAGYAPQYYVGSTLTNELNGPLNIATGPEGSTWITNYNGDLIVQIVGLASPTTTPLSQAAVPSTYTVGGVGNRP
jgi:hypothetical protein